VFAEKCVMRSGQGNAPPPPLPGIDKLKKKDALEKVFDAYGEAYKV
jgi:hypothetical protein